MRGRLDTLRIGRAILIATCLAWSAGSASAAPDTEQGLLRGGARPTTAQTGGSYLQVPLDAPTGVGNQVRVDPARGPARPGSGIPAGTSLRPREYINLENGMAKLRSASRAHASDPNFGYNAALVEDDWDDLTNGEREILEAFGLSYQNALAAFFLPYNHYDTVTPGPNEAPKRLAALDFDHYTEGQVTYKTETRYREEQREDWEITMGPVCGGCVNGVSTWSGRRGTAPPFGAGCCTMVERSRTLRTYTDIVPYTVTVADNLRAAATFVTPTKMPEPFHDTLRERTVQDWEIVMGPVCGGCVNGVSTWSGRRGTAPPFGAGCCTMVERSRRLREYVEQFVERTYVDRLITVLPDEDADGNTNIFTLAQRDAEGNAIFEYAEDPDPNDGVLPPLVSASEAEIQPHFTLRNVHAAHGNDVAQRRDTNPPNVIAE